MDGNEEQSSDERKMKQSMEMMGLVRSSSGVTCASAAALAEDEMLASNLLPLRLWLTSVVFFFLSLFLACTSATTSRCVAVVLRLPVFCLLFLCCCCCS
jgi:hypothetical protein